MHARILSLDGALKIKKKCDGKIKRPRNAARYARLTGDTREREAGIFLPFERFVDDVENMRRDLFPLFNTVNEADGRKGELL